MNINIRKEFDRDLLANWFIYNYKCFWCGKNHWDIFHHILEGSDSILNAAPLFNDDCHIQIHKQLRKKENVKMLLRKTLEHLLVQGYSFNENDIEFIKKHRVYYEEILKDKENEQKNKTKKIKSDSL